MYDTDDVLFHHCVMKSIPRGSRIAVAMSGGVDSSVVAAMAKDAGHDVVGITLQLYDHGALIQKKGACCAGQDIYDAKRVCEILDIPHYVLDYESRFRQDVMDDFVESYVRGETPVPCIRCNQNVKFRDLLETAKDLGAVALLTGHYVKRNDEGTELHQAFDKARDQSYFLFTTTKEQLKFLRFPLGTVDSKTITREYAKKWNLPVSEKPDSQDICFVPGGRYADVIKKLRPDALTPGNIVHIDGRILGTHEGIVHYTVGQRKGLGVSSTEAFYVIRLEADSCTVVVGPKESLATQGVLVKETNWLTDPTEKEVLVKIRSSQDPIPAKIKPLTATQTEVTFVNPEYGVSKGQACVFYEGARVLGGGWIV